MMSRGGSNLGQGLSKMVNQGIKSLIEDGLGQQKESAADHVGVMYAVAAGYDPMGLHRFLNRIASSQKELKLGKTHPPFDERIKLFNEFIQQQQLQKVPSASNKKILESRFKKGMGQA
jgi:predicted Zn-dependent protease